MVKLRYKVHKLKVQMLSDIRNDIYIIDHYKWLEDFLNELEGEVIAIIPNTDSVLFGMGDGVNYLFVVEKRKE